jgi:hypothetical protein
VNLSGQHDVGKRLNTAALWRGEVSGDDMFVIVDRSVSGCGTSVERVSESGRCEAVFWDVGRQSGVRVEALSRDGLSEVGLRGSTAVLCRQPLWSALSGELGVLWASLCAKTIAG